MSPRPPAGAGAVILFSLSPWEREGQGHQAALMPHPPSSSPNKFRHGELTLIPLWQGGVNFIKGDA